MYSRVVRLQLQPSGDAPMIAQGPPGRPFPGACMHSMATTAWFVCLFVCLFVPFKHAYEQRANCVSLEWYSQGIVTMSTPASRDG